MKSRSAHQAHRPYLEKTSTGQANSQSLEKSAFLTVKRWFSAFALQIVHQRVQVQRLVDFDRNSEPAPARQRRPNLMARNADAGVLEVVTDIAFSVVAGRDVSDLAAFLVEAEHPLPAVVDGPGRVQDDGVADREPVEKLPDGRKAKLLGRLRRRRASSGR